MDVKNSITLNIERLCNKLNIKYSKNNNKMIKVLKCSMNKCQKCTMNSTPFYLNFKRKYKITP